MTGPDEQPQTGTRWKPLRQAWGIIWLLCAFALGYGLLLVGHAWLWVGFVAAPLPTPSDPA